MFNDKQQQIFTGSMLGDGCIAKVSTSGYCRFQLSQSKFDHQNDDKISYMKFFANELEDFSITLRSDVVRASGVVKQCSKKESFDRYVVYTERLRFWEKLGDKWYVPRTDHLWFKRRKIVPIDIKLTPLTLCIWHMEDGSNSPLDANIELNTQGFTVNEIDFLIDRLKQDLGIISHKKVSGKKDNQYKIYVGRESYFDFINMIKPHIEWHCFKYKIDTTAYIKTSNVGKDHPMAKMDDDKIREIFELRDSGTLQKEIARKLEISTTAISLILSGDRWSHLGLKKEVRKKPRLSKEQRVQVIQLRNEGLEQKDIAERLNTTQSTISRILAKS